MRNRSTVLLTRRDLLRSMAGVIFSAGSLRAASIVAAELPHLTAANPSAATLGYTEDSSTVDAQRFPTHKSGQRCASCKYFQPNADARYAPCLLYPGNAVSASGWCAGYVPK